MGLPEEFLFDTVFNLRRVLKPGGRLLISTPLDGPTTDPDTQRDSDGRLFNGVTPENRLFNTVAESIEAAHPFAHHTKTAQHGLSSDRD